LHLSLYRESLEDPEFPEAMVTLGTLDAQEGKDHPDSVDLP
jgi:hypothetical protein